MAQDEPKICRICYSHEVVANEDEPDNLKSQNLRRILINPCHCKGSMAYVHEFCLVKWLLTKNIRYCELCKAKFTIKEEMGSHWEIFKQLLTQSIASKKRISCSIIYSIYLYFLSKRFIFCARYLSKTIVSGMIKGLTTYLRLAFAELKFLLTFVTLPFRKEKLKVLK